MDFEWVAIALGDFAWIALAFLLGFVARLTTLPPLVGFLATGFILNYWGVASGETLQKLADLGITLLLFTVGLKLNLKVLIRPQIWAVTLLHTTMTIVFFGTIVFGLALMGASLFSELDLKTSLLLAFALSFSSTVFVAKSLEEKGEMLSLHGRIAIGILVVQDLIAVLFLAISMGKTPSLWAFALFLLIPARLVLVYLLKKTGHGELMILYGLVLALGGAELFEMAGIKDDLGALVMGALISAHPKAKEMAKSMLGLKDLFLVGFFLSIGMAGQLSLETLIIGVFLVPFIFGKSILFFALMSLFKLRARTSLLATLNLTNYSEFGLIVAAIGVEYGWIDGRWLVVIAIALSLSFMIAAPLNNFDDRIYGNFRAFWMRFQLRDRLSDDKVLDTSNATIAIFGMGRIGTGAYDRMREFHGDKVVGIDFDADRLKKHQLAGRNVLPGDPSDADFWDTMNQDHHLDLIMLALPNFHANRNAIEQLQKISFSGRIASIARYPDEEKRLIQSGVTAVFNIYTEAGTGFADHIETSTAVTEDGDIKLLNEKTSRNLI